MNTESPTGNVGLDFAVWVASRMANDAHATHRALEASLTFQARMNEARYNLAIERVLALLDGQYMPTSAAIQRALLVSDRAAEEWLESEYIEDWRDINAQRKGW